MRTRTTTGTALGVLAVALVALNLRGPLVALPSVAAPVASGLGVGAGGLGVLTTLPVLCFGLAAPLASLLIARTGLFLAVLAAMGALVVGLVVRSSAGYGLAIVGTVIIGLAITVGNVAVPVVIGELFPTVVGLLTAAYTATFNVGSTLASVATPALTRAAGWRTALAAWSLLALLAALVWWPLARTHSHSYPHTTRPAAGAAADRRASSSTPAWRRMSTWGLAAAFAAQAFSYYGATAWLPQLLHDVRGMRLAAAGSSASIFQLAAVAGAFGVPALLRATGRLRLTLQVICLAWITLPVGLLLAPGLWWLWCTLAGAAQGGGFTVIFVAVLARSGDADEGRQMSATVQAAGYVVGAFGPTVVGAVHDASGGWTAPLVVVAASVAVLAATGSAVMPARPVHPDGTAGGAGRSSATPGRSRAR